MYNYRKSILNLFCLGILLVYSACEQFDYSPHQVLLKESERNLNQKSADRIAAMGIKATDTLRVAFISDTQRFFDETEDVVKDINRRTAQRGQKIDFVIHAGDITDFGIQEEFGWQHALLKKLKMPYLLAIGNHDCVGNGKKIYRNMYGPYDYTLQVAQNRFVFQNTNSLEFNFINTPDLNFLENALRDVNNYQHAFVIGHVPPFDADFDRSIEQPYAKIIRDNPVKLAFFGHQHTHRVRQPYDDGVTYVVVGSVQNRVYVILTIVGNEVKYETVYF